MNTSNGIFHPSEASGWCRAPTEASAEGWKVKPRGGGLEVEAEGGAGR